MIKTSLRQAAAAGRQIYVRPRPETLSHARGNLRAFPKEAATRPQPQGFAPIDGKVQVVDCLGWTELKGSQINARLKESWVPQDSRIVDETYPAIVYRFVAEEGIPAANSILAQLDFFHLVGFLNVNFNETNWRGKGVFVDISDIVSYHTGSMWWRPAYYAQQQAGFCRNSVERAAQKGLLGPRPEIVQEAPRHPVFHPHGAAKCAIQNLRRLPPPPPSICPAQDEDEPTKALPSEGDQPAPTRRPVDAERDVVDPQVLS